MIRASTQDPISRTADAHPSPDGERFTRRLEAFSDLVFGFSLSLLATRLDVPTTEDDLFNATRWATFIVTFGIICVIWLAHYRVFRHGFIARTFEVIVNFIFLLAIAVLPYVVQTFLRFQNNRAAVLLYFGDFTLTFAALATLRLSALRQRRDNHDAAERLREWRGVVRQFAVTAIMVLSIAALGGNLIAPRKLFALLPAAIAVCAVIMRLSVRRLPAFLEPRNT